MLGMSRIGEASSPGPQAQFEDGSFTIGTFNPSGLRNKAHYFCSHLSDGDLWTISETHFFGRDVSRFRAGLNAVKSMHRFCVTDQPSLKSCLLNRNAWKGVCCLSKHPTRVLPSSLPQQVLDSGRALLCTSLIGDAWISGAVMYGEPNGHSYPAYLRNNEYLLHHLASHVCNLCVGPRFVSGDWNVDQDTLPAFDLLAKAGFRDLQDIALERWGDSVQLTCKGRTRKDFLYVSPELQDLLVSVKVVHDIWPDHSVLSGRFRSVHCSPRILVWPTPAAFPWPKDFAAEVTWPEFCEDPTASYAQLWKKVEAQAKAVCPYPVAAKSCGRAQCLTPKQTKPYLFSPVKVGRKGDFQPGFFGPSVKHSQWIRQTRRLQAFCRLATSVKPEVRIQVVEAWSAILRAKGFAPSFAEWWLLNDFRTGDAPSQCPLWPPSAAVAEAMYESMSMAVRQLESDLKKVSRQYAKFRRDQNPNIVFADVRPPAVPGVDVLLQPIRAVVEAVDLDAGNVVLDRSCNFQSDGVFVHKGTSLSVIHHDTDALWLEDCSGVEVGDEISQTRFLGKHSDLERTFVDAWKARWMRHVDVPAERWDLIVQFAKRFLPPGTFSWAPISGEAIASIIRTKKRATSMGFDGVSLQDLRQMPSTVLAVFSDMFQQIECTGVWPRQLLEGKVVSLAKVPTPGTPADFRPITVFSLLYRVWSSFHSRHALAQLDDILPETLYGSRPGRYAAQVWSKMLWSIEHSFQESIDLSGLVVDLQKAFNMLPRLAVFEIAGHLGLPSSMLLAWAGALSHMQRRFLLRGSLTEAVPSVTGFPEGCGLSCVAMVLVDFTFHRWLQAFFPLCTPVSYVDDWQVLCAHSMMVEGAKRCLERFVAAVDLQLDSAKSYAWSLSAEGRQSLRSQGFRVVLAARNLGAHIQVCRKHTNSTLVERIKGMSNLWPKLRLSACSYRAKVRALLVAAWPRALHAVAATGVGAATMHTLRTGAMKGLDADGAGCNAWVHLGLVEHPLIDPEFWAIIQTIRCARDCGDHSRLTHAMQVVTRSVGMIPDNCITMTLVSRLQTLGWHIGDGGIIFDHLGSFSLFTASMNEVVMRARWAWQCVVAAQVTHRPGFHNLHYADPGDTREFLRHLASDDLELFHKCLNGSHITQEAKMYCQEGGDSTCPYCDCVDSRFHRFWVCARFAAERACLSSDVLALIPDAPDFLTGYGWSIRPYTLAEWYRTLSAILIDVVNPLTDLGGDVHLFTDGSCLNQTYPTCRVASWAVVLADSVGNMVGQVLDVGPLPGILQSSYRAEIFAVLRALQLARMQTGRIHLWTDCSAVVTRLNRLLRGVEPKTKQRTCRLGGCRFLHACRICLAVQWW